MQTESYFSKKAKNTLVDTAYKRLEEMIVTAELRPDTIITETELSNYLNIGRTPIREALKKIALTHAIAFLPRKGILIRVIPIDELLQQIEVRSVLEDLAIKSAVMYANAKEREDLRSLAKEYRRLTEEWKPALEALYIDDEFNHLLCKCSRNPYITDTLLPLYTLARRNYYLNYFIDKELTYLVNFQHSALMDAIADGDLKLALECNEKLMQSVVKFSSLSLRLWLPDIDDQEKC